MLLNKNILKPLSIAMFLIIAFAALSAQAQPESIKARMLSRLPVIDALKEKGVIGEANTGYLAFVGESKEKADVVSAENEDRRKVYTAIAKQQGTTPELVGKRRALQIAEKAVPGTMLQNASGAWYKK